MARLKAREADRRKDWCEKTSTMLARTCRLIRFEKLNITTMTRSAKKTVEQPGTRVRQKAGLNRAILAQGWGLLRRRTGEKAPDRGEDVPAPHTSLRCSACGWIEKDPRKSQAESVCISCGFDCHADENTAVDVAAGQGGIPRPGGAAGAGGVTAATGRSSACEPRPTRVGIPLFQEAEDVKYVLMPISGLATMPCSSAYEVPAAHATASSRMAESRGRTSHRTGDCDGFPPTVPG